MKGGNNMSPKIIRNGDITVEDIRKNTGAPKNFTETDIIFRPDAYLFIVRKYHIFAYLFTQKFPFLLKSQFEQIIGKSESMTRKEIKKMVELKLIGQLEYKKNKYIYPLHRFFQYVKQRFNNVKRNSLTHIDISESALLTHFMRAEVYLKTGNILSSEEADLFHKINVNEEIGFTKELLLDKPHFNWTALEHLRNSYKDDYVHFAETNEEMEQMINKEVPERIIRKEDYPMDTIDTIENTGLLYFNEKYMEALEQAKIDNIFFNRFKRCSKETQNKFFVEINRAAFQTLIKKNVYVLSMRIKNNVTTITVAIFFYPDTSPATIDNIISALQFINVHRMQNTIIKPIIVTHTSKNMKTAFGTYKEAIEMREIRGKAEKHRRINIRRRMKNNLKEMRKPGLKNYIHITESDITKHAHQYNWGFKLDEVEFLSLEMENYFSQLNVYENAAQKFDKNEYLKRKKSLVERMNKS